VIPADIDCGFRIVPGEQWQGKQVVAVTVIKGKVNVSSFSIFGQKKQVFVVYEYEIAFLEIKNECFKIADGNAL
jgi:hypothetical protein